MRKNNQIHRFGLGPSKVFHDYGIVYLSYEKYRALMEAWRPYYDKHGPANDDLDPLWTKEFPKFVKRYILNEVDTRSIYRV
jgi:hypothetical protein